MNDFDEKDSEYLSKTFAGLDLSGQRLVSKEFDGCTFIDCDFSEAVFEKCRFIDCQFEKCNLSLVRLNYSKFIDVIFKSSKLIGVDWTKAAWANILPSSPVGFSKCIINDSSFFGLELREIAMEECKAHDVDFREGDFRDGVFDYTDFAGSLFSNTNLSSASFAEAANYDIDVNLNTVREAKFTRLEAVRLLNSLGIELLD
ncbi:MAG: pentapeptide repeat-containing protein [Endozoicomonas sp.]